MKIVPKYKECMEKLLQELENEFMRIIANPKLDKKQKNILTKPLVTKKQILLNTLESLTMIERREDEE
ncbi:hypothetical protein NitYY0826_C1324 [Nitratiruptor sp. YY08-26]|uniref:hypothetical protein n=1 Tax=unclassified Nitratiruptor TaxID=2624044 RepID=UPI0019165918|nr:MULTISPECIES: hypothetical protein [unclassified Nitratiruptor]BCD62448.1 hypothetical protein NitYY0813_C1322 [Nitratiruptor sp. YY08-13]BCD66384.1 hypothetical protein NitYY0826_C1324 [Nitratiruptor sp. YY08-26]